MPLTGLASAAREAIAMHSAIAPSLPIEGCPVSATDFLATLMYRTPGLAERMQKICDEDRGALLASKSIAHLLLRWLACGMPAFRLSTDLMSAFVLTDAGNLEAAEWKMPFGTFVALIPPGFWKVDSVFQPGRLVDVWGVFFNFNTAVRDEERLRPASLAKGVAPEEPGIFILVLGADGTELWRHTILPTAETLAPWLEQGEPENPIWAKSRGAVLPASESECAILSACRRLCVNLSLFVTEQGRGRHEEVREHNKAKARRRTRGKRKDLPQPEVWKLGSVVKLAPELVAAAKACGRVTERKQWRVSKRFTVRGHWRNQAHGPGRSLHRRQWIQPYWKGPPVGEKLSHLYETDE
jgi:hypothetical protein